MKLRLSVILSTFALVILVVVQYYNISVTFETKREQFDTSYGAMVKQALFQYEPTKYKYQSDSVFLLFDQYAEELVYSFQNSLSGENIDTLKSQVLAIYSRILQKHRKPDDYLREYLEKAGAEPDFRSGYYISELSLLDFDRVITLYRDTTGELPPEFKNALYASSYAIEGNYFRIRYDYLIDFTHKTQIIYRDMVITLVLAVLTILIVVLIFTMTMRNMIIQKRLSDLKTDFINNMTHELKTPLSTISVASSALGNPIIFNETEKVTELSALIKKQNRHLSELIDRILDINIWERDQVRLRPEHIAVEVWIRELVKVFRINQGEACASIELKTKLQHETHLLDEVHMSTVINNLLSNAVKYGKEPCRIGIEVKETSEELWMEVRDNGPGIRKEELRHLFEKFYRGAESKQRVIRGLGLGLYYVKQIVEAHHGTVSVRSTPGKGSTFTIKIPIENGLTAG
ncbi:MAG: HAMP domain-containing histidine kinase [Bacteroidales bacterium]|nr:HAMP domain-containing histidine kinase [Bacteroidales bacterium]